MRNDSSKSGRKTSTAESPAPRLSIAIEYVGIIAIVCLFAGALIGGSIGSRQGAGHAGHADGMAQTPGDAGGLGDTEAVIQRISQTTDRQMLIEIGNQAYDTGRPDIAIPAYEKALTYDRNDVDVLTDLAAMYVSTKHPEKAAELTRRAASLDPKHAQSRYWLGMALAAMGDKDGARAAFTEVTKLVPGNELATEASKEMAKLR